MNVSKKGVRERFGLPGTEISYQSKRVQGNNVSRTSLRWTTRCPRPCTWVVPRGVREVQMQQYQIDVSIAEDEIRQRGFEMISRDNRFIDRPAAERPGDRPDDHVWWLIVARKPAP